jgi:tungstate transport system substrate-binding protein
MDGNVDIIFVHAKDREEQFVAEGFGTRRYPVMYNDFVLIGSDADPAGIKGAKDAALAFRKIAASQSPFVSRGDDSGTHTKEQAVWRDAGIPLVQKTAQILSKGKNIEISAVQPENPGTWYLSIGQGMGAVLTFAEEKQAYALTDRGTYLAYKYGRPQGMDLEILCEGDARLKNEYGLIPVNPAKHSHVRHDLARTFTDWITGPKGQNLIAEYKIFGRQLFYPDAEPAAHAGDAVKSTP